MHGQGHIAGRLPRRAPRDAARLPFFRRPGDNEGRARPRAAGPGSTVECRGSLGASRSWREERGAARASARGGLCCGRAQRDSSPRVCGSFTAAGPASLTPSGDFSLRRGGRRAPLEFLEFGRREGAGVILLRSRLTSDRRRVNFTDVSAQGRRGGGGW